jgi:acetyl esterase
MARERGGPALRFQLLVYPVVDGTREYPSHEENAEGYFLTTEGMRWFWAHYAPDVATRASPHASPIRADLSDLPPALVLTAEYDPLRDEGEAYAAALAESGIDVQLERHPGQIHGFFGMTGVFDAARRAFDGAAASLRRALA